MERKKPELPVILVTYNKQLKKFLNSQEYLTELDFIEIEIPDVKKEIEKFQKILTTQKKKDCFEKLSDNYIPFWLSSYQEFLTWLESRKSILEKPLPVRLQAFSWTGNDEQLKKLYDGLTENGFIDPQTDFKDFTAIFAGNLTSCKAIKWRVSNKLLSYLFNQLYSSNFIIKEWQSIIEKFKLFQNKTGKYLTAQDLASALNSINDPLHGLNPKGSEKIDIILKNLKTV
jgi:hypothetical protein